MGDDRLYPMYELDDLFFGIAPSDLLQKFDFDEFNINDEYFKCGIYGITSTDYRKYDDYDVDDFIGDVIDNRSHLDLDADLEELLDELEASRTFWDEV